MFSLDGGIQTATNVFFLCITESAETIDLYQDGKLLDMIGTTAK